MNVELISMTQPKRKDMDASDLISYCARVSNPSNQNNFDTSDKLIRYLIKKSHWSPFQMVDVTFEIKTTRDIGRQILRHRSFEFQEFSQRYAVVDIEMFEDRECRIQDEKNRQSSHELSDDSNISLFWKLIVTSVQKNCAKWYKKALSFGVAKEQARALLPEGLTPSTMYMKGSLRSWFHFCLVRYHPGTQKEHRLIAIEIWRQLQEEFPFFKTLNMQKLSIRYQEMFEEILGECYDV